jgi:hypothetical protein
MLGAWGLAKVGGAETPDCPREAWAILVWRDLDVGAQPLRCINEKGIAQKYTKCGGV